MIKNQVIIQARMGSSRLPGKVLLPLNGRPVLEYVVRRSAAAARVGNVVVATSDLSEDDTIENWCRENGVTWIRGSSDDVLGRYLHAEKRYPCQNIVRITADCPLVDPGIIDSMLALHQSTGADYTSNEVPPTFPVGFDVEVVKTSVLKKVDALATLKSHREHVTLYIREHTSDFKILNLDSGLSKNDARLTLDRPEDYDALKALLAYFPKDEILFSFYQIMRLMRANPEIAKINSDIDRFEGLKKSIKAEKRKLKWQ
jgi:spore coat polysaccharide biosynthesis protein SpsF